MLSDDSTTRSVVRLIEREDMTTEYSLRFAQAVVNTVDNDNMVLIWSALPCTGGSPWQNINKFRPGGKERIEEHWKCFKALWNMFVTFVDLD